MFSWHTRKEASPAREGPFKLGESSPRPAKTSGRVVFVTLTDPLSRTDIYRHTRAEEKFEYIYRHSDTCLSTDTVSPIHTLQQSLGKASMPHEIHVGHTMRISISV